MKNKNLNNLLKGGEKEKDFKQGKHLNFEEEVEMVKKRNKFILYFGIFLIILGGISLTYGYTTKDFLIFGKIIVYLKPTGWLILFGGILSIINYWFFR